MLPDRARPPATVPPGLGYHAVAQGVTCPASSAARYAKDELRRLVGGMAQLAGIRLVDLADGRVRGMRAAEVFTGSGFRFQVLVDRGLDLGAAEHAGRPLAWLHPALGSPALREPRGIGWLRTFGGGLVTTCGLDHFGPPDPEGEGYGLHGRASHLPAENLRVRQEWRGDEYVLEIEGETRQARLFGENLRLERRVDAARRDQPGPRGPRDERGLPARAARGAVPLQPRLPGGEPGLGAARPRPLGPAPRRGRERRPLRPPPLRPAHARLRRAGLLPRAAPTRMASPAPRSSTARSASARSCAGARRSCRCSSTGR